MKGLLECRDMNTSWKHGDFEIWNGLAQCWGSQLSQWTPSTTITWNGGSHAELSPVG